MEFHEYRSYAEGDDPRLVDWRVFARTDRHCLRTFEQETNMELHLVVDTSGSMGHPEERADGALTKLEFACYLAACLAWLVVRQTDRVSLHLFDTQVRASIPPGSTRAHLHQLLRTLECATPGGETTLAAALHHTLPVFRRRGTLVILSDFLDDPAAIFHALNPCLHRGFRVHLFQILAPDELRLARTGLARWVDMETGERLVLHSEVVRAAYEEAARAHNSRLRALAASRRVDFATATTAESYFGFLDRLAK